MTELVLLRHYETELNTTPYLPLSPDKGNTLGCLFNLKALSDILFSFRICPLHNLSIQISVSVNS